MIKAEIVREIANNTGVEPAQVMLVVEAFMENVKDSMAEKNVYLRGFGSFVVKTRAKKVARSITQNTAIVVPEYDIPAFKPSLEFAGKIK